ncbi:MAG: nucleotidyltransferase domain-containing protein [Verrucomicrobia bacterium]|nr:nucleotidyltransferase domain-containing protein [Verrucomicrobiota bacterium]
MTVLLDGNALIALRLPGHEHHARAHRWFAASAPEPFMKTLPDDGAEKIIAFGSCAHGKATEHSDIDLCVIREHPSGCTHRPGMPVSLPPRHRASSPRISSCARPPSGKRHVGNHSV